jgi:hypothetical protein
MTDIAYRIGKLQAGAEVLKQKVEKFNHNHDAKGMFASGASAGHPLYPGVSQAGFNLSARASAASSKANTPQKHQLANRLHVRAGDHFQIAANKQKPGLEKNALLAAARTHYTAAASHAAFSRKGFQAQDKQEAKLRTGMMSLVNTNVLGKK